MERLRSDRDRIWLGERVLAARPDLVALEEAVGRVVDRFSGAQDELAIAMDDRQREEAEDRQAREHHRATAARLARHYFWAWDEVPRLVARAQDGYAEPEMVETLREVLFVAEPHVIAARPDELLAACWHLLESARTLKLPWPQRFLPALEHACSAVAHAALAVAAEEDESRAADEALTQARDRWESEWLGLRDVTRTFVRLRSAPPDVLRAFRLEAETSAA